MKKIKTLVDLKPLHVQLSVIALIELAMLGALIFLAPHESMELNTFMLMLTSIVIVPISTIALYVKHDQLGATQLKEWVHEDGWKLVNRAEKLNCDGGWGIFTAICAMALIAGLLQFT